MKDLRHRRTRRLRLRPPRPEDADAIFETYSADPEVTRHLGWPRHRRPSETREWIDVSAAHWRRRQVGPYLVHLAATGELLGGTGLELDGDVPTTGFVLARSAWGHGYATELLEEMVRVAREKGCLELVALCHEDNRASQRVLGKVAFAVDPAAEGRMPFPNTDVAEPETVLTFRRSLR